MEHIVLGQSEVLPLELRRTPYSFAANNAVEAVIGSGITVVVAAGNDDINASLVSPASAPDAITVGASAIDDKRSTWVCNRPTPCGSNWGPSVDIFAAGTNILSAGFQGNTALSVMNGTSMGSSFLFPFSGFLFSFVIMMVMFDVEEGYCF